MPEPVHWWSRRTRGTTTVPLAVLCFRDKLNSSAQLPFSGHSSEPLRLIDRHATQRRRKGLRDPLRIVGLEFASPCVSLIAGVRKDKSTIGFFLCRGYCAVALRWLESPTNPTGWIKSNAKPLESVTESHDQLFLHLLWFNQRQEKERSLPVKPDAIASGSHTDQVPFASPSSIIVVTTDPSHNVGGGSLKTVRKLMIQANRWSRSTTLSTCESSREVLQRRFFLIRSPPSPSSPR